MYTVTVSGTSGPAFHSGGAPARAPNMTSGLITGREAERVYCADESGWAAAEMLPHSLLIIGL
jgi:hypothetical protein